MVKLKLIVCCDANYGIGKNNKLPWNIPKEMKIFKGKTIGNKNNCVIMGKNTFNSIPEKFKPLQQRHNCVLTSDRSSIFKDNSITVLHHMIELKEWIKNTKYDEYWVIGGKMLYNSIISNFFIDEIHISKLEKDYNCDCFFDISMLLNKSFKKINQIDYKIEQFTHMIFKNQNKDYP